MNDNMPHCLVILSGGQSQRMGSDKAEIRLNGERLIDRIISRFRNKAEYVYISAAQDYGTGLPNITDDPQAVDGPVGAIFTLAQRLPQMNPGISSFITLPVDAPFVPENIIQRLTASAGCTAAESPERLQPAFAHWCCDTVNAVRNTHALDKTPSLHWLIRQCGAQIVSWPNEQPFMNINTPDDLKRAEIALNRTHETGTQKNGA